MTEVYLVTSGEYSDYFVDSVWSTREAAQEYIDLNEKHNERFFGIDCAQIEVFTLNTKKPSMVLLSAKLFDQLIPNQEPGEPVMVEW